MNPPSAEGENEEPKEEPFKRKVVIMVSYPLAPSYPAEQRSPSIRVNSLQQRAIFRNEEGERGLEPLFSWQVV